MIPSASKLAIITDRNGGIKAIGLDTVPSIVSSTVLNTVSSVASNIALSTASSIVSSTVSNIVSSIASREGYLILVYTSRSHFPLGINMTTTRAKQYIHILNIMSLAFDYNPIHTV